MRMDVAKVPETENIEYTSQELFRNRCHERPMMRMTTFAMNTQVNARKM
jgi:hypothetical protein